MKQSLHLSWFLYLVIASLSACGGGHDESNGGEAGSAGHAEGGSSSRASSSVAGAVGGGEVARGGNASSNGGSSAAPEATGGASATGSSSNAPEATGGASAAASTSASVNVEADKLDLLLMIDNSLSMTDKQGVLAVAVPRLLGALANPDCIAINNATGAVTRTAMANPTDTCAEGQRREFASVMDIHIGVVTSSLGDFGGDTCPESTAEGTGGFPDQNDHGWLLGALPRAQPQLKSPFLSWTAEDASDYAGRFPAFASAFANHVTEAGSIGCGFEMSLESWYRFLIDPEPPKDVGPAPNGDGSKGSGMVVRGEVDNTILELRKQFLRSDSLVAVLMLTDENDCSLKDSYSYSWVPARIALDPKTPFRMWRGSSTCATDPNDPCCYSCMAARTDPTSIPSNCPADPECTFEAGQTKDPAQDPVGLRCHNMKQRFGFDFLFPVTRYSNALTLKTLCPDQSYGDLDCECTEAKKRALPCDKGKREIPNPLYSRLDSSVTPTGADRNSPNSVFLAGILGVPWQDLATAGSVLDNNAPLVYKVASELDWDLFAPTAGAPKDPLMIETPDAAVRLGKSHPITGEPVAPADAGFMANSINGHEWNTNGADLQFSCIFSLDQQLQDDKPSAVQVCDSASYCPDPSDEKCKRAFIGCSCSKAMPPSDPNVSFSYTINSPLCQKVDGTYTGTQVAAKAYPSVRQLQALRHFHEVTKTENGQGNNAVVASICPKDLTFAHRMQPSYGYGPAVSMLVSQLAKRFKH